MHPSDRKGLPPCDLQREVPVPHLASPPPKTRLTAASRPPEHCLPPLGWIRADARVERACRRVSPSGPRPPDTTPPESGSEHLARISRGRNTDQRRFRPVQPLRVRIERELTACVDRA